MKLSLHTNWPKLIFISAAEMNGICSAHSAAVKHRRGEPIALRACAVLKIQPTIPCQTAYPSATSSTIITLNPTAKNIVPMLECSPCDISGISSSTTT